MRISAEEFFRDCYGVMSDTFGPEARVVRLKITAFQANYVRDLPLHESQQEIERNDEYSIFELFVRPTYDLFQEVLRMGTQVEVLEPNYMREEILEMIRIMYNQYTMTLGGYWMELREAKLFQIIREKFGRMENSLYICGKFT